MTEQWLTSQQAAERLGVKPETIYAYVSRGTLANKRAEDGRSSLFAKAEVERLAQRSRRGSRSRGLEVVVDTEISLLDPAGRLFYRGLDACRLARTESFEWVAEWLWTGVEPTHVEPWQSRPATAALARQIVAVMPDTARTSDLLRTMVAAISGANPAKADLRAASAQANAVDLLAAMVDGLPRKSEPVDASIAARLWAALSAATPTSAQVGLINSTLVLLVDHELAISTFATRLAASARADPYLVVSCGMAVLGGPLHGAAGRMVRTMLDGISGPDDVPGLVADTRASGQRFPGFGHSVYEHVDPRADVIMELLRDLSPAEIDIAKVEAAVMLAELVTAGRGPLVNVDFAFGSATWAMDLPNDTSEVVFAVARTVGWIAHALEEYEEPFRFRPRAAYVGPEPES